MFASFDTIKVGWMANANHPIPAEVRALPSPLGGLLQNWVDVIPCF
jgi:hypothetical protein